MDLLTAILATYQRDSFERKVQSSLIICSYVSSLNILFLINLTCSVHHITSINKDNIELVGKNPLQGDRCITSTNISNVVKLNIEESEYSRINVNINITDIVVKKVANRRKPIQYLEPKTIHPVYEPRTDHNKCFSNSDSNNNNNCEVEDDKVPIVNYVYYS
jgi:hypothetical protein